MTKIKMDLDLLEKLYVEKNFNTKALAELFEVNIRTIQKKLKMLGHDLVKDSKKPRDKFGRIIKEGVEYAPLTKENNGNFKGGISIYRKIVFEEYRLEERCYDCDTDKNIVIHHLDENRNNNDITNLRPVCNSCHMKVYHPSSIEKARAAKAVKHQKRKETEEKMNFLEKMKKEMKGKGN